MPQLGPMEILVVGVLALIVFGPDKLPEIARTVGGFIKQIRAMADDVKQELSEGFEVEDEPDDEELAALAGDDDSEVARLEEEAPEESNGKSPPDSKDDAGGAPPEHPVAGAIEAEREASRRAEGA